MSSSRSSAIAAWMLVVVGIGVLVYLWLPAGGRKRPGRPDRPEQPAVMTLEQRVAACKRLLQASSFAAARDAANEILSTDPGCVDAMLVAAQASAELQDRDAAIAYYDRVPVDSSEASIAAGIGKAAVEFYLGTFSGAEAALRSVLARRPTHLGANQRLAELLDLEGRKWEMIPFALEVARQGKAGLQTLMLLADQKEMMYGRMDRMEAANRRDARDPGPLLGLSRAMLAAGQKELSETLTRQVIELQPDWIEPHVRLGELVLDKGDVDFLAWHAALPAEAESHPDLWLLRGQWAERHGQREASARCFWEVVRRNPNDAAGHMQLSVQLKALGREDDAVPFHERALLLSELRRLTTRIYRREGQATPEIAQSVVSAMTRLGRMVEAISWQAAQPGSPPVRPNRAPAKTVDEMIALWVDPARNPALRLDLSDFPLPDFAASAGGSGQSVEGLPFHAQFDDLAARVGIDFTFIPAPDPTTENRRIIELTGGGAGALDFDRDDWPDLLLTQGGRYPAPQDNQDHDRLYRNQAGAFVDVTEAAGLRGYEYGQGVGVGDFNADGFPDVYVANLGRNRFWVNNGDGTFTDITESLGDHHTDWSTSVAIMDANGDGLPDIYVANYLGGDDIYSVICQTQGQATMCHPDQFEAAQDRFYLNLGDGRFADKTSEWGLEVPNGKGLGLLAADFDLTGRLQLFVANDGVPNFFFAPRAGGEGFDEIATAVGVAISAEGDAQACMGVAVADADADGRLDFFVTNFEGESNTLYANMGGLFRDATRQAGLRDPSYDFIGFGTQFVDGENDSYPDLLITNGHVSDFSKLGRPYRMRPQYLRNRGNGVFQELSADEVGEFFGVEQVGRAMARLDWNRDGRSDVAISHLDTPAALLTNTSSASGHWLTIRLVGMTQSRDAVGATVWVRDGDWSRMQQVTAGDGYQCSNQRSLCFGLGERTQVPRLEVRWLDGTTEAFESLAADREIVLVQGAGRVYSAPR